MKMREGNYKKCGLLMDDAILIHIFIILKNILKKLRSFIDEV